MRVAVVACCLVLGASTARAQVAKLDPAEYCRALHFYVGDHFESAAVIVGAWPVDDLKHVTASALTCPDVPSTIESSIMLVTELAMRQRTMTVQIVQAHLELAASLLDRLPRPRPGSADADVALRFREEWYVLASSLLLAWTEPGRAGSFADRGLRTAPGSARLHTLAGMALEMRAHIFDNDLHDRVHIDTLPRSPARTGLVLAEPQFRKALALDADADEARVHLGRVMFLLQQHKEAREAFAHVIGREHVTPRLRYLAHLFAGAMDEIEHDWPSARQHYEQALAIGSDRQTPYVALSFVETATGHDARARELVETWSQRKMSEQDDPWGLPEWRRRRRSVRVAAGAGRQVRSRTALAVLASTIALGVTLAGQTFKAGVELVRVDVSVTRGGQPVRGLTAADFSIVDAGVPQRVNSVLLVEELPLDVQMVLDTSGSVAGEKLQHLIDAGRGLLAALKPEDQVGLMTFGQRIQVNVPSGVDHTRVGRVLPTLTGQGPTAVRDAIWMALQLRSPGEARPLVLAFSDGIDTASWLTASALLEGVRRTGIVIHSVELAAPSQAPRMTLNVRQRPLTLLEQVSESAGGRSWSATSSRDLRELFTRAIDEMRARYLVTFYPEGRRRPGWHELKIGVKGHVDVKARPGYYLGPQE